eukprot:8151249-Pyramimonas_sp.AAC.1
MGCSRADLRDARRTCFADVCGDIHPGGHADSAVDPLPGVSLVVLFPPTPSGRPLPMRMFRRLGGAS